MKKKWICVYLTLTLNIFIWYICICICKEYRSRYFRRRVYYYNVLSTICVNNNIIYHIVLYRTGNIIAGNLYICGPSTKRFARRRIGNRLNLHGPARTGRAADTNPNYSDITSETVSLFKPYNFLFVLYAADTRRRGTE